MKYLVLGGASFVGTNLAIELNNRKHSVTLVDKNVMYFCDEVKCFATLKEDKLLPDSDFISLTKGYDVVIHLISFCKSVTESVDSKKEIKDSILFTNSLLKACEKNKIKKVLFVSSGGTVYGNNSSLPLKESDQVSPISPYGKEKVADEKCFENYNLNYHIVRLSNPYGPFQRVNGSVGVLTKFVYKIMNNEEIAIFGDGNTIRDYIYIEDATKAMINIIESDTKERLFNIGSGIGLSLNELLNAIQRVLNKEAKVVYQEARQLDVKANYLDVSKYNDLFENIQKTPLDKGILLLKDYLSKI